MSPLAMTLRIESEKDAREAIVWAQNYISAAKRAKAWAKRQRIDPRTAR